VQTQSWVSISSTAPRARSWRYTPLDLGLNDSSIDDIAKIGMSSKKACSRGFMESLHMSFLANWPHHCRLDRFCLLRFRKTTPRLTDGIRLLRRQRYRASLRRVRASGRGR
jgi:hypothetical protein